jgi:hypothetical protein
MKENSKEAIEIILVAAGVKIIVVEMVINAHTVDTFWR